MCKDLGSISSTSRGKNTMVRYFLSIDITLLRVDKKILYYHIDSAFQDAVNE
jgi:hypothetical protein